MQEFNYMKVLTLVFCKYLTHIPDVSGLPNLEKCSFRHCYSLITIHNSIGHLNKLEILNASECIKLEHFPPLQLPCLKKFKIKNCYSLITIHNSIGHLNKLEILNASGCIKLEHFPPLQLPCLKKFKIDNSTSLKNFPELLCKMTNIKDIQMHNTSVEELPSSFQNFSELQRLTISGGGKLRFPKYNDKMNSIVFSNVEHLNLAGNNLSDECLPILLKWFVNVKFLDLSYNNNFKILPECLGECHRLKHLYLKCCKALEEIRGIPPNLERLLAGECYSLSSSSIRMLMSQVCCFFIALVFDI